MTDTVKAWIKERQKTYAATDGPWENTSTNRRLSGNFIDSVDEVKVGHLTPRYRPEGASWPQRYDDHRERLIYTEPDAIYWGGSSSDVKFIVDAHNNLPRALDALNAVLELHRRAVDIFEPSEFCAACSTDQRTVKWPCATVQAIESALKAAETGETMEESRT